MKFNFFYKKYFFFLLLSADDILNLQFNTSLISYSDGSSRQNFNSLSAIEYVSNGGTIEFIVVSDHGADKLIKFDLNFNFIKSISTGSQWMTSSSDSIYVNSGEAKIIKYNFDLTEITRIDCTKVCDSLDCCYYRGIFYRKDTNQLLIAERNT